MLGATASCNFNITGLDDDGSSDFEQIAGLRIIASFETFLEAGDRITRVLCTLLLRTWSKETGAIWIGQNTFGGESNPEPGSIQRYETDKSTRLTDGAFGIAEEPLDIIRDSRHLHEMVLVEPPDVFLVEMASDRQNGFAL